MSRVDVRVAAFVLAAALPSAGIVVLVVNSWGVPEAEAYYWRPAAVVNVTVWLTYALTGALLYRRRPDTPVGWLLSGIGLGMLLAGFAIEYSLWTIVVGGEVGAGAALTVVAGQSVWVVPFGLLAVLLTVYPTGRAPSRSWAVGIVAAVAAMVLVAASAVPLWRFRADALRILTDDAFPSSPAHDALLAAGLALLLGSFVAGALSLVVRWRRSRGVERLQVRWLMLAGVVVAVTSLATFRSLRLWAELLFLVSLLAVPVAVSVAILRYRLYEIDRIISRTVTYAIVSAVLVAVYAALAVLPAALLTLRSDLLVAAATLATAATAGPLHRRVQAVVDRRFNRSRYDATRLVESFGAQVRHELDVADLLADVRRVIGATVQPAHLSMWLVGPVPGRRT